MVQDNITNIINSAVMANRNNKYDYEKELVSNFILSIRENIELFKKTNEIDLKNNNGFKLNINLLENILTKYENIEPLINTNNEILKLQDNLLKTTSYTKLGIILVIFDGNTYAMLEMILLSLLTHNTIIFSYDGYMGGTNGLLVNLVQTILEKQKLNNKMIQQSLSINSNEYFKNFKTINKTIIIGNNEFTTKYVKECTTEVKISNYKNYNIYIDSIKNLDFIKKILSSEENINIYINKNININSLKAIYVEDIDEAITQINYNGSKYLSLIFTEDSEIASKYINEIDSENVLVNVSPTIKQNIDIAQEDLLKKRNIFIPNIYKLNDKKEEIKIY